MYFVDSHAHLSSPPLLSQIDAILLRAKEAQVSHILNICTDLKSLEEGLRLTRHYPFVQNVGATPPHDVEKEGELAFPTFAVAAREKKIIGIGETGLDYYYEHSPKEMQRSFLQRYLHLAEECRLPVIFHCRDAFADLFSIADDFYPKKSPAILHCFTGTSEEAMEAIQRGWFLSFSGIVTFKKSDPLREVVKKVPLSQLLIETDAPYLAPQSQRGKPNEPSFLPETAECIAKVKGVTVEEIATATADNAKKLFPDLFSSKSENPKFF